MRLACVSRVSHAANGAPMRSSRCMAHVDRGGEVGHGPWRLVPMRAGGAERRHHRAMRAMQTTARDTGGARRPNGHVAAAGHGTVGNASGWGSSRDGRRMAVAAAVVRVGDSPSAIHA